MVDMMTMWVPVTVLLVSMAFVLWHGKLTLRQATPPEPPKPQKTPVKKTCSTCIHFDLEAGQAAFAHHAPFARAAQVLTPYQMGSTARFDDMGNALPRTDGKKSSMAASWGDLGACNLRDEGVFKTFTCPNWHDEQGEIPEGGFAPPVPLTEPAHEVRPHVPTAKILERMQAKLQPEFVPATVEEFEAPRCKYCGHDRDEKILHDDSEYWICDACRDHRALEI